MLSRSAHSLEFNIKACLTVFVLSFLTLIVLLTHAWGWSLLAICTSVFVSAYPLCWIAWRVWHFWSSSIMRLSTYTQSLAMGESAVLLAHKGRSALIDDLTREIEWLHKQAAGKQDFNQSLSVLFGQLFEDLPIAILVFDADEVLTYANSAAYAISEISLLHGMRASELGFTVGERHIQHPALESGWRCQTSFLHDMQQSACLFTAIDISNELKQSEQAVQKNLVRVLSHELRNTLTPMSSMAATILSMHSWDATQVRKVLERVQTRSDALLAFVQRFAAVAKIPEPKKERFELDALVEQSRDLLGENDTLTFTGQQSCYADAQLMAQVLINLIKNAIESAPDRGVDIRVSYHQTGSRQCLTVADNGAGFSNIDNALTPLFTTKLHGAGIGLAFVEAVLSKHKGKVQLSNLADAGAKVELTWPAQNET